MMTSDRLHQLLDYDTKSGVFTWNVSVNSRANAGDVAGCINGQGYRQIKIDGRPYLAHRLAWLCETGNWPKECIDHVNGDRADNRFENLREATNSENQRNARKHRDNSSGFKGVSWQSRDCRWQARIQVNKKCKYLGLFDTKESARAAYLAAAMKLHGSFAREE